jgi:tRNA-specific 2-thiouridylase
MNSRGRVVVGMSGGVDSALAAALLVEQGFDVVGVAMRLWEGETESGCCSLDDFLDARLVAERLAIPFYVMDFRDQFRAAVVDNFVDEYRRGRTPNPCVRCNHSVKFASFWDRARELGAEWIATGHYARRCDGDGGPELLRGVDRGKDQSYFLFSMGRAALARTLFPVGHMTKVEVRAEAARRRLPVAAKPDSQEICFAPRGTHAAFVAAQTTGSPPRAGVVVDTAGSVVGTHAGVHLFTIGQRRGLGIAAERPLYVTGIDADSGVVRVGTDRLVGSGGLIAAQACWLADAPATGAEVQVKIRSKFDPQPAVLIDVSSTGFALESSALRAVAPGQAAVLYDGERVLGGGWIERATGAGETTGAVGAALFA